MNENEERCPVHGVFHPRGLSCVPQTFSDGLRGIKRYRKKPVEVDAMWWDGTAEGATPIVDWVLDGIQVARFDDEDELGNRILISTLEGVMEAKPGDFIIKGIKGEFYPCKPGIFEESYLRVG